MILRVFLFSLAITLATPQSHAIECRPLFDKLLGRKSAQEIQLEGLKQDILRGALSRTKITLTQDQGRINRILSRWDLPNSTPQKIEELAQELVFKIDEKESILKRLGSIVFKPNAAQELVRVRVETLVLKEALLEHVDAYIQVKDNTRWQNIKAFREKHYNKIQLAKFAAINTTIYIVLNQIFPTLDIPFLPVYTPWINLIRSLDVTEAEVQLVKEKGFKAAYPTIRDNHKLEVHTTSTLLNYPRVAVLGLVGYIGYNVMNMRADMRPEMTQSEVESLDKALFAFWKEDFKRGHDRYPDLKNREDKEAWDQFFTFTRRFWEDDFNARHGRLPDTSKKEDLKDWNSFVENLKAASAAPQE